MGINRVQDFNRTFYNLVLHLFISSIKVIWLPGVIRLIQIIWLLKLNFN